MTRHTDDEMRAMVRKYTMEQTAINHLSESERLNHVVQEMKYMVAVNLGFASYAELECKIQPRTQATLSFAEKYNIGKRMDGMGGI